MVDTRPAAGFADLTACDVVLTSLSEPYEVAANALTATRSLPRKPGANARGEPCPRSPYRVGCPRVGRTGLVGSRPSMPA